MRRRRQRRADKARRHAPPSLQDERRDRTEAPPIAAPPRVVVRQAEQVVRLAYTRSQAAQALGISRSTLGRLLACVETIELPWGTELIPVDELERVLSERRRAAAARPPAARPGRKPRVPVEVVERIRRARAAGRSFAGIAVDLNADEVPTVHGGRQWWPSTVRAVLVRSRPARTSGG